MVKPEKWRYGIVLDAGSSGTRLHIYRWLRNSLARQDTTSLQKLPELESKDKWTKKQHTGLSTYGGTPELIAPDHLEPLFKHALKYIPPSLIPETPVFLLATAGMRLLPQHEQDNVLQSVCQYVQKDTSFLMPDCSLHVQIIPGETEGLYGWLASNYLLESFGCPPESARCQGHHTYGFLDMGGASAQLAFVPNATEAEKHANDLKVMRLRKIDGSTDEYKVFTTSWLGYGMNEARRQYLATLMESYAADGITEIPEPCLPSGVKLDPVTEAYIEEESPLGRHLLGTGDFEACLHATHPLLRLDAPCPDYPCLVNGQHVPAIDFSLNHFIGISNYWHTTHEIFEMGYTDKAYDFATYQSRVRDFCSQPWATIEEGINSHKWGKKIDEETAYEVCFKASWLINMLHDGIGIPRVGIEHDPSASNGTQDLITAAAQAGALDPFQAVNTIKSTEVSWTLGKMLLYASSTIPPPDIDASDESEILPVGFGSNIASEPIPADWTYPSINGTDYDYTTSSDSLTSKLHDTIFHSDTRHRLPGFIFFLLIVVIGVFYLCGRDRRSRLASRFLGSTSPHGYRKGNNPVTPYSTFPPLRLLQRLLRGNQYTRVSNSGEEGQPLHDSSDFELNDISSDDELKSEGRLSPRRHHKPRLPKTMSSHSIRSSPDVDRRGVVLRTESRENLGGDAMFGAALGGRNKSRNGSPARFKGSGD